MLSQQGKYNDASVLGRKMISSIFLNSLPQIVILLKDVACSNGQSNILGNMRAEFIGQALLLVYNMICLYIFFEKQRKTIHPHWFTHQMSVRARAGPAYSWAQAAHQESDG